MVRLPWTSLSRVHTEQGVERTYIYSVSPATERTARPLAAVGRKLFWAVATTCIGKFSAMYPAMSDAQSVVRATSSGVNLYLPFPRNDILRATNASKSRFAGTGGTYSFGKRRFCAPGQACVREIQATRWPRSDPAQVYDAEALAEELVVRFMISRTSVL